MNERAETISRITDMLQRADAREMRFVYVLLRAMLGEKGGGQRYEQQREIQCPAK
ncbi:MAG: hypothetical protein HDT16_07145 [Oscillibacter sp.]|nr:hypothetical protein [Oscillibacter sp.]